MVRLVIGWGLNALALYSLNYIVPGLHIDGLPAAVMAAGVLAFFHLVLRPVVILLTLPVNIMTLGCFTFIINAIFFGFAAYLVRGFEVGGFGSALLGSLLFGLLSSLLNQALNPPGGR